MTRWRVCALCIAAGSVQAAPLAPLDFAYTAPLIVTQPATAYRVTLPLGVYKVSTREDLSDLRVFNARNEVVPYTLRPAAERTSSGATVLLPLFTVRGAPSMPNAEIKVRIDASGAIHLEGAASPPADTSPIAYYIVDARKLDHALAALSLTWPEHSADFSARIKVEVSEDLAGWRSVAVAAPIASLHAGSEALLENRVDIPAVKAKFWRLTAPGMPASAALTGVAAEPASGTARVAWSTLFIAGTPERDDVQFYDFDLGASVPAERVNLVLPELNAVYVANLSSRAKPGDAWRAVTHSGFYRVSTADGEQRNGAIEIARNRDRYWRVQLLGEGARPAPLKLEMSFSPSELLFLAQGPSPYLLAFGRGNTANAESNLSVLPESAHIADASLGAASTAGGEARLRAILPYPWARTLLWAVLVAAVAALALMALRLSRDARTPPP